MGRVVFSDHTVVGDNYEPYIIAEVNSSHGGKFDIAVRMIDVAKEVGCDCVKFQSWSAESLYSQSYYNDNPIAKRFVTKFSLSPNQLCELAQYARSKKIGFSSTPYSEEEVDFLVNECNVPFIKIASMELNNDDFLKYIAQTGKPLVLSTGMGTKKEVDHAVNIITQAGNNRLCLLHCISIYPCQADEINLNNILWLKEAFPECVVGFSDHSLGTEMASAAVALGARLIEKHLTLDKRAIGMDNQMATEPIELEGLVKQCHNVFHALGSKERIVSNAELDQRLKMRRSLVYSRELPKGHILTKEDFLSKRPGTGIPPTECDSVIGRVLTRDVKFDMLVDFEDFA